MAGHSAKSSSYLKHKADAADLSILEKLDTIPAILTVLANTIAAIFTRPLRSGPDSYYKYVALTTLRTFTRRTSVRQQHYLAETTDDGYIAACKKRGYTPNSEILEDGTRAHWIGDSKAEKLILNFHGGGYVFSAAPEMFDFMFQVVNVLKSQGKSVAVLFLSYDLAPGAIYPRQLQQASALLNHVITKLSISPKNIILTGDSAGGNLILALLSHISHPHPSTTVPIQPLSLSEPFRGAVLISPWTDFSNSAPSYRTNAYKDIIDPRAVRQWADAFIGEAYPYPTKSDYYNQPITAPESWWDGLKVQEILVLAGEQEVLVDSIKEFEGKLRRGVVEGTNVELLVAKGEYHDQPSVDLQIGYKEKDEGEQAKKIKGWISSKL